MAPKTSGGSRAAPSRSGTEGFERWGPGLAALWEGESPGEGAGRRDPSASRVSSFGVRFPPAP